MRLYRNIKLLSLVIIILSFIAIVLLFDNSRDKITGEAVNTHVEIIPVNYTNCSFELYPGWNMVSFYCLGLYVPRNSALRFMNDSYDAIFEYTANDINGDPWKSYKPSLPNWTIQQITYMDRLSGYWVYTTNGANFSYDGVYSDSSIYLYDGWNFIGYPYVGVSNITQILSNISFTIVKNYRKNTAEREEYSHITNTTYNITYYLGTDVWLVHVNGSMSNNLTQLETYRGYWINVSGNQTWYIIR
jgi:hypothetical protein